MKKIKVIISVMLLVMVCFVCSSCGEENGSDYDYESGVEDGKIEGYNQAVEEISDMLKATDYNESMNEFMANYAITEMGIVLDPDEGATTKGDWKSYNEYMKKTLSESVMENSK